jgi:protein ImuB
VLCESHVPERAVIPVSAAASVMVGLPLSKDPIARFRNERPLRLFSRPEKVEAVLAEVPDGPPQIFRWRRLRHQVAKSEGPERLAMEWWIDGLEDRTRDYFRIEDQDGRRFWLFRRGLYGGEIAPEWFMHGVFA